MLAGVSLQPPSRGAGWMLEPAGSGKMHDGHLEGEWLFGAIPCLINAGHWDQGWGSFLVFPDSNWQLPGAGSPFVHCLECDHHELSCDGSQSKAGPKGQRPHHPWDILVT